MWQVGSRSSRRNPPPPLPPRPKTRPVWKPRPWLRLRRKPKGPPPPRLPIKPPTSFLLFFQTPLDSPRAFSFLTIFFSKTDRLNMIEAKLLQAQRRFQELSDRLMRPDTLSGSAELQKLTKERSDLEILARKADEYFQCQKEREEARALLSDGDPGLRSLASAEMPKLEERLRALEKEIRLLLIPKDPHLDRNAFL